MDASLIGITISSQRIIINEMYISSYSALCTSVVALKKGLPEDSLQKMVHLHVRNRLNAGSDVQF